jgi:hypothetical protein
MKLNCTTHFVSDFVLVCSSDAYEALDPAIKQARQVDAAMRLAASLDPGQSVTGSVTRVAGPVVSFRRCVARRVEW